jgi:hypothetical protein
VVEVEVDQHHIHKDIKMDIEEEITIATQEVVELLLTSQDQDQMLAIRVPAELEQLAKALLIDGELLPTGLMQDREVRG